MKIPQHPTSAQGPIRIKAEAGGSSSFLANNPDMVFEVNDTPDPYPSVRLDRNLGKKGGFPELSDQLDDEVDLDLDRDNTGYRSMLENIRETSIASACDSPIKVK